MRKLLTAGALLLSAAVFAETPTAPSIPPLTSYGAPIAMDAALMLIERGIELSKASGHKMAIAIVEPNGELVAFARMDDAPYGSIQLAQDKAKTAARYRLTTASAEERVLKGRIVLMTADHFVAIGGGVPIVADGKVIGAIGVSGATAAEDAAVATATLAPR